MNNKIKTYLLLVVVIAVWGAIGYQVLDGLKDSGSENIVKNNTEMFRPKVTIAVDTFSIQNTIRDPFLGTIAKKSRPKKVNTPKPIEWMPIVYNGNFKNNVTGEYVYVLRINDTEHLLKRRSVVDSVTLISGNSSKVVVSYKGQQKTIKLHK